MKILILHLSDIHIRSGADLCFTRLQKVAAAVANEDTNLAAAVIVVSGDVAFSGAKSEYQFALEALKGVESDLRQRLRDVPVVSFAVPGNHDCNFKKKGTVRDIVIKSLNEDPSQPFAPDACDACVAVQTDFFDFLRDFESMVPTKEHHRAYYEYSVSIGAKRVLFRCFNTALTSQNPEKPMELVFPVEVLNVAAQFSPHDFVVSVFHHPTSWITQAVQKSFSQHVESLSDLMLTGHEHEADSYSLSRARGDNVAFVEGAAFQEHGDSSYSGFNGVWVDLESQTRKVVTYQWKDDHFEQETPSNPWQPFKRGGLVAKRDYSLNDEFERTLHDPGAGYTHPSGQPLSIHDIFVYPDGQELKVSERVETADSRAIGSGDLLKYTLNKRRVMFLGQERIGKSTLSRVLFLEFYERNLVPVLLNGSDIASYSFEKFVDLVQQKFKSHYQNPKLPQFEQLERDQTVIIIDDFDHAKLSARGRLALLENIHKRYERICLFSDESIRFDELREAGAGKLFLADYAQVQLLEYGLLLRTKIITKWVEFGSQYDSTSEDLNRRISHCEFHIDELLKQGYLPSLPFFVLTLLQALSDSDFGSAPSASYAKLQEILITNALAIENRVADVITKETYLAEYAFTLFKTGSKTLDEKQFEAFHITYDAHHDTKLNSNDLREELKKASILTTCDGETGFKYNYHYYYFVAHYFWKNLHIPAIRERIELLATRIHREETANIWVFLTYLSPDPWLRGLLLKHARGLFANGQPIRLDSDVSFLCSLYDTIPKIIHQDDTPESIRERRRQAADLQKKVARPEPTDEEYEQNEFVRFVADLNDALRTIDVLGQIVKTFAGQLDAEAKRVLIEECYDLGLRVLGALLAIWKHEPEKIVEGVIDGILNNQTSDDAIGKMSKDELTKLVKRFIFMSSQVTTFAIIKRISHAVGSPKLELSFDRLVAPGQNPTFAVRLVDASVRLDISKIKPKAIIALHKELQSTLFADVVLKHLVLNYFRLFHTDYSIRQALCEELGISIESGKRFALLRREQKRLPPKP